MELREVAQEIVEKYDFIAVTERFEESMVIMQLMLEGRYGQGIVTLGDMLYLSAKSSGGYDDGGYLNKCYKIRKPPPVTEWSDRMKRFYFWDGSDSNTTTGGGADSNGVEDDLDGWIYDRFKYDYELWRAANRSLDLTIDAVGRTTVFEPRLKRYRAALGVVRDRCGDIGDDPDEPLRARFPCNPQSGKQRDEEATNCLYADSGCGYRCLDRVAAELNLHK